MSDPEDPSGLKQRLERLERLSERPEPEPPLERRRRRDPRRSIHTRLGVGMAFIAMAIATGNYGILIPGVILVVMAAAAYLHAATERTATPDPTRPLEGMAAGMVRIRTTGVEAGGAPETEMLRGVQQLHEEIDAIADALEELSAPAHTLEPIAPIEGEGPGGSPTQERTR